MADLYDRLDEIQGMTRVLAANAKGLATGVGYRSVQAEITKEHAGAGRAYVRAIFSLVEAIVEQHKRPLLDLASNGYVTLDPAPLYRGQRVSLTRVRNVQVEVL
jgi:hypothetical protein